MKKFVLVLIIIAVVIVGVILIAQSNKQVDELEKISIRLKWLNQAQFAGFYYADKAGYYKDAGLDVTLNAGGLDFPAIQMVAGGSDDFGVAGADQILLAREKGVPVVAVANIYQQTPLVLFSLRESNITMPNDLVGKKVGIKYGQDEELIYRATLNAAGVDQKRITEIPIKYNLSLLLNKDVDAMLGYSINEPFAIEAKGKETNLIYPADYGVRFYSDTLFTSEKMIKNNPDLVRKVVRATVKGWEQAIKNPEQAVSYTLQYDKNLARDHETKMLNASIPLIKRDNRPIGFMDHSVWASMQDLLLRQGFMKQAVDVDKTFTTEFLP